jgi:hypothetical protein
MRVWIFVVTIVMFGLIETAQANNQIAGIQAMLAKPKQLCGSFEQTKHLSGLKKPLIARGRFCVVADKGVLWRTLTPFPSTLRLTRNEIVQFQGERVAMRLDAKQEPTVRVINGVLFSLLSGDLAQLEQLFEVDAKLDGNSWRVALKGREAALAKVLGAISLEGSAFVKQIHIVEASGDKTIIVFSDIKTGEGVLLPEEVALF